ncbi:hypothetical protein R3P38DRAFT_1657895 [Favolaschia claudopus]|uniref:Glucose-methanol-choline oxidoreductase N-terminal domain-containing protein n=1 Tax=Favolaschia claudopus TaxID=2862362 RepID=A0AAW0AEY9_9AGAR
MLCLQIALSLLLSSSLGSSHAAYAGSNALGECPQSSTGVYDYIVVGSGAGGGPVAARLAENGFSVLVIETGVDESKNINTTTLALNFDATDDPKIDLNYTIREYPSDFRIQRNDVWYPRAAGIGGCTIHNAMDNGIGGLRRQTFDKISGWFNDSSWTRDI